MNLKNTILSTTRSLRFVITARLGGGPKTPRPAALTNLIVYSIQPMAGSSSRTLTIPSQRLTGWMRTNDTKGLSAQMRLLIVRFATARAGRHAHTPTQHGTRVRIPDTLPHSVILPNSGMCNRSRLGSHRKISYSVRNPPSLHPGPKRALRSTGYCLATS